MTFSEKICLVIMLNVTKNSVSLPFFSLYPLASLPSAKKIHFLEKPQERGVVKCQIDHSLAYFSAINVITSPTINRYSPPT